MKQTENLVSLADMMPLIREMLDQGKSVRIFPRGTSMLPIIRQGIDSVVLSPVPDRLRKYDIPLYRRDNGMYILHRVVGTGTTYTCVGDNQFDEERNIRHDQMIAVVTGFYRGEKFHSAEEPVYGIYCRIWRCSRGLRHLWRRGTGWIRRCLR